MYGHKFPDYNDIALLNKKMTGQALVQDKIKWPYLQGGCINRLPVRWGLASLD